MLWVKSKYWPNFHKRTYWHTARWAIAEMEFVQSCFDIAIKTSRTYDGMSVCCAKWNEIIQCKFYSKPLSPRLLIAPIPPSQSGMSSVRNTPCWTLCQMTNTADFQGTAQLCKMLSVNWLIVNTLLPHTTVAYNSMRVSEKQKRLFLLASWCCFEWIFF